MWLNTLPPILILWSEREAEPLRVFQIRFNIQSAEKILHVGLSSMRHGIQLLCE
jgi:hypothetical protein